jgi:hypothetical protein
MSELTSLAQEPMDNNGVRERLIAEAIADGRKLVTIREISAIDDIPGADLIKVAQVEGWKVVVKAGEFQPGDYCVFFEVDSFLPLDDPRYSFLEKNKITWNGIVGARLKTIRLRKQLSQGLALPIKSFPELTPFLQEPDLRSMNFTAQLGIMKWEKVLTGGQNAQAKGGFPSFLRKSDQERAQNMGNEIFGLGTFEFGGLLLGKEPVSDEQIALMPLDALSRACEAGRMVQLEGHYYHVKGPALPLATYEVSLKMDGSSMTVFSVQDADDVPEKYGVCSRNLELKLDGEDADRSAFVKVGKEIISLLEDMDFNVALQGELMGPGIQGNREGFKEPQFFIYNIFDIATHEFMTPIQRKVWISNAVTTATNLLGKPELIQHVPVLHENVSLLELGITNMDELLAFAVGPSLKHPVREGLVFKATDGRHQFKVISNQFLLEE